MSVIHDQLDGLRMELAKTNRELNQHAMEDRARAVVLKRLTTYRKKLEEAVETLEKAVKILDEPPAIEVDTSKLVSSA